MRRTVCQGFEFGVKGFDKFIPRVRMCGMMHVVFSVLCVWNLELTLIKMRGGSREEEGKAVGLSDDGLGDEGFRRLGGHQSLCHAWNEQGCHIMSHTLHKHADLVKKGGREKEWKGRETDRGRESREVREDSRRLREGEKVEKCERIRED